MPQVSWRIWEIQNWYGDQCNTQYQECYYDLNQAFLKFAILGDYDQKFNNKIKMEIREEQSQ